MKRQKEESNDKYPWLDKDDKRKNMAELRENYADLEKLCLSETERKELMDMLYKNKDVFSLSDEIVTCPNIQVEMNVKNKSPFL